MSNYTEKHNHSQMENQRAALGLAPEALPPPYSSLAPSQPQEYTFGSTVLPTAPYPMTPVSGQVHYPMSIPMPQVPQPYYGNSIPMGTAENQIIMPSYNHNATQYTPAPFTSPARPVIQDSTCVRGCLGLRIGLLIVFVMIMVAIGGGTYFYVKEMF